MAFIVLCNWNPLKAQTSVRDLICQLIMKDSIPKYMMSKNLDRFAVMVSESEKTIFNLKDTVICGLKISFFSSKELLILDYDLKRDKDIKIFLGSFSVNSRVGNLVNFYFSTANVKCDKFFFKRDLPLLFRSNGFYELRCSFDLNVLNSEIVEVVY